MGNASLVDGLRRNQRSARERLVAMYFQRLVFRAIGLFSLSREDAEELVNDVLLAIILHIDRFAFRNGDGDFHCWVMTIFRRKACDAVRKKIRRREYDRGWLEDCDVEMPAGSDIVCSAGSHQLEVLEEVLDGLHAWERMLLRCRADEMSYAEISAYVQKSPAQLKVYHSRVMQKLHRLMVERISLLPSGDSLSGGAHTERLPGQTRNTRSEGGWHGGQQ